jgi:hypothetical protein
MPDDLAAKFGNVMWRKPTAVGANESGLKVDRPYRKNDRP